MKTLIKTLLVATLSLSCASVGFTADEKAMMKDHLLMKDGKMMVMKDGKSMMMKEGEKK